MHLTNKFTYVNFGYLKLMPGIVDDKFGQRWCKCGTSQKTDSSRSLHLTLNFKVSKSPDITLNPNFDTLLPN